MVSRKPLSRPVSVGKILEDLENRAPSQAAESWDNVGLLAGDPGWKTQGAVVCVDLTAEAIEMAKKKGYRLIINHHPCIFPKSKGISAVRPPSLVFEALRSRVAVIASHTNFDRCALEVPEALAQGFGLKLKGRLLDHAAGSLVKLSVFVPETHIEAVRDAICEAGAGKIGHYDFCTFGVSGTGTFRGGDESKPFLGQKGRLERAKEVRLETILPRGMERIVLQALFKSHPYEEVAYDLYPVEQTPDSKVQASRGLAKGLGYGFWGDFPKPIPFSVLASCVKSLFEIDGFWITQPAPKKVQRIGFVAGKGASFIGSAASVGCDVFITGEAGYHDALSGSRRGVAVMELGHRESERFFLTTMRGWLKQAGIASVEINSPVQKIYC